MLTKWQLTGSYRWIRTHCFMLLSVVCNFQLPTQVHYIFMPALFLQRGKKKRRFMSGAGCRVQTDFTDRFRSFVR